MEDERPRERKKPPAGRRSLIRPLLITLFILLIVATLVIGALTETRGDSAPRSLGLCLLDAVPWLLLFLFVYLLIFRYLPDRKDAQRLYDAVTLLDAGQVAEAASTFDQILARKHAGGALRMVAHYHRGVAHLYQGRFEEGLRHCRRALDCKESEHELNRDFRGQALITMAEILALQSRLGECEDRLGEAESVLSPARAGLLLPSRVIFDLRRGDPARVPRILHEGWPAAEGALTALNGKKLRLLWAFALSRLENTPERQAEIQGLLGGLRPFRTGQFDYLTVQWPELESFLQANGLTVGRGGAALGSPPSETKHAEGGRAP
jgi:hypothetical protein